MPAGDAPGTNAEELGGDRYVRPESGLRIRLLGGFRVDIDEHAVADGAWRRRKAANLVKLLALSRRQRMHREEVLEYLWPEQDPDSAGANLRVVLHAARRALRPEGAHGGPYLQIVNDEVALFLDGRVWTDVDAFEHEAMMARRAGDLGAYRRALDLYQGELLPEDRYEDWTVGRRERIEGLYLALLVEYAALLGEPGDAAAAIEPLERALTVDPTHELAAVRLMEAYSACGQRSRALRLFQQLRDALERELDTAPDEGVRRLYGEILSTRGAKPVDAVRHVPVDVVRTNIHAPLTRFIGREQHVASTIEMVAASRLVTLSGTGGSGKTRLAIAAAGMMMDDFSDGVWMVDLSPLVAEDAIPQAIASALDLRLDAGPDVSRALLDGLRDKGLLLVLDNCEHLIEACASMVRLILRDCPHLHLLATSREPLHIDGETVLRVPAMSLPKDVAAEMIAESEAVQLFCDRARYVQPDFAIGLDNAHTIAAICRRLDGLPLAIELAAARVSLLSLDQLADRLSDPFQVLAGRRRDEPRQQTLRATLDWSFDLLGRAEQLLLARLSVFSGGWDLEAAEAVCEGSGVERRDVLGLLAQLVDKSLVEVRAGSTDARYRLLETVRQYAREKLETHEEAAQVRELHAIYFLTIAETGGKELTGSRQGIWLGRLEQDHDNLRAALRWSSEEGSVEIEARLCAALWRFWGYRSYLVEGEQWISNLLAREGARVLDPQLLARLHQGAGALAMNQGHLERSSIQSEEALRLFEKSGDRTGAAATLHVLGMVAALQDKRSEAQQRFEASLRVREEVGDTWGMANTLLDLGNLAREAGQLDRAGALFERSLALQQQIGNTRGTAISNLSLGVVALDRGDYARSIELSEHALELFRELGDRSLCAIALNNIGYTRLYQGDTRQAAAHQIESLRQAREAGDNRGLIYSLEGLAGALALSGGSPGVERAARIYGAAEAMRLLFDLPLPPADKALNEQPIAVARAVLGDDRFEAARADGRLLEIDKVVSLALAASDLQASSSPPSSGCAGVPLSTRELEVARLVARELTNRQIAGELNLSVRTVDTHVRNILRKLNLTSRHEIADWIEQHASSAE